MYENCKDEGELETYECEICGRPSAYVVRCEKMWFVCM